MSTPDKKIEIEGVEDLPLAPFTLGTTRVNHTGSWRFVRPTYHNATAPCLAGCPNGNDIQAVMRALAEKNVQKAWKILLWENPFPSITGRVCYHPCEPACNRGHLDEPMAIHMIERFVGDYGLKKGLLVEKLAEPKGKSIAVVGSGPSGLATAYHLARLGHEVVIFEAKAEPGGVLRYGIPEYRLPKDILRKEIAKLERLDVEIRTKTAVGKNISLDDLQQFDAIFLGIGLDKSRRLNIPGEKLSGVLSGIDLLLRINNGEPVELGERVAVIGGGNTAMDAARSALRLGKKVHILYRRSSREMPAIEEEINDALAEGAELHTLVAPVRVLGEGGKVTGLELVKMQLGEPDASGRRRPIPIEGSEFRIEVDTVITAIGEQPDFSLLPDNLHHDDWVVRIDPTGRTTRPPIFAGGDIIDQPHTVVDALASGKRAAMAIDTFLCGFDLTAVLEKIRIGNSNSLSMKRYVLGHDVAGEFDNTVVVRPEDINLNYFTSKKRVQERYREVSERLDNFDEVDLGATAEMVFTEALRCFNCGVCNQCDNCIVFCPDFSIHRGDAEHPYLIDYDYCKGCGICAHECPRHAIAMVREEDWQ